MLNPLYYCVLFRLIWGATISMKRPLAAVLSIIMMAGMLSGCGAVFDPANDEKLNIVSTIFPIYDWVNQIVGTDSENVDVTLLLDKGIDLHNYQATADDIIRISTCDMFIYVGGESDEWVADALSEAMNEQMVVIDLLDILGDQAKEEEVVEGMQQDDDHEAGEDEHGHEGSEYDEHVWLSIKNAVFFCQYISEQLCRIDSDQASVYEANTKAYIEQLNTLDVEYQQAVDSATRDTVLFGDRFPFRYLVDDYGLNYYAAFAGCSAETEASFETIMFLAGKVDELELDVILQIETSDGSMPNTIKQSTMAKNQTILIMNSLQSTTSSEGGTTYLSVMKDNLEVLKEALR